MISTTYFLSGTKQGHHMACANMPSLFILVTTRFQSHGHFSRDRFFLQISVDQHIHIWYRKITILTHTSCSNGDRISSRGNHACMTNTLQISYELNIFIIQFYMQTNTMHSPYHVFKMLALSMQKCWVHSKTLKIVSPLHFLFSKCFNYHTIPKQYIKVVWKISK